MATAELIDRTFYEASTDAEVLLPEPRELQEAVELAAEICGVPICLLSLMDEQWQTVQAAVGLRVKQVRRDLTMCAHTIEKNDLMIVKDTMDDIRFAGHPMVTGDPEIRFYAGLPLHHPSGQAVGTLCVVDLRPRQLSVTQERALRVLVDQIKTKMALRAEHRALQAAMAARDRADARLSANTKLFQAFMNNGPLVSYLKDAEGRFVFYNARLAERFHVTMEEWLGCGDFELWPEAQARLFREHDLEVLRSGRLIESEETTCEDGTCTTWRSYKFPCEDESGRQLLAGLSMDVTEERRRQAELDAARSELGSLATVDTLTGLPRRRIFDEQLETQFEEAQARRRALSLMVIDVDDLRQRNQRMSAEAGDEALRRVGEVVRLAITDQDLCVRFAGAEFALLLPETTAEEARDLAERLQRELRATEWGAVPVTLSIGIATNQHADRSGRQLFCFADDAMYSAKTAGKNRVVVYTPR